MNKTPPAWFKGSYEDYRKRMSRLAGMPHKRGGPRSPKAKLIRQIEIKAEEEGVPMDVIVKRMLK